MTLRNFLITVASVAILVSGCASTAPQDPNAPPPLRVGVSGGNAPIIYEQGRRNFVGVEADFARMLAAELGRELQFVPMSFDRLIPAVQGGEVDIVMSGLTVFDQRKTLVDFTDSYMTSGQGLLVPTASGAKFDDPRLIFITPFHLGAENGSVGHLVARRSHQNAKVTSYSSPAKAAKALAAGKVDAVVHDAPVLWRITADNPTAPYKIAPALLNRESLAWAVRRGDATMRKEANAALAKWRSNGTLNRTLRTHMPRYDLLR